MAADTGEGAVREAFAKQAEWCQALGSPFMVSLMQAFANLDRTTAVGRRVLDWPGRPDALSDAVALRLAGSLHALVRRGDAPELAAVYPPNPTPAPADLWLIVRQALIDHEAALMPRLDLAPQTNEVGRSAALMAGLLYLAHESGLPVSLYELGSSAGLNLNLDRFEYDLGGLKTGAIGSPVRLTPGWTGAAPPNARVSIIARRGVDLSPLSAANPAHRELLTAYVWPDQTERLQRVEAAIKIARDNPPPLDQGEAADWIERVLAPQGPDGVMRVVFHTIAFQYFPAASQARIRTYLERIGAQARDKSPLAWLRLEADPEFDNLSSLRLTVWPDGTERVLGVGSPHGASLRMF